MALAGSRGRFGSRLGFILAAAGSAIGLGNIWGFPYMAAQSGGGAFVLLYILCVVFIGIPVLFGELAIGRTTQLSPVSAFKKLAPGFWPWVGGMGVAIGFAILSFYSLIAGWTVNYLVRSLSFAFAEGMDLAASQATFDGLQANDVTEVLWTAVFAVLTMLIVRMGVAGGIERLSKILMPAFFVLLVILVLRSMTLPGAGAGIRFLFNFDLDKITGPVIINALAQALFSMSLGMGAMITYGSYLSKDVNLPRAGGTVAVFDSLIGLLAGLMIFPALFAAGAEPAGDTGLVFVVLPTIFDSLPAGNLFAIAFYLLLTVAAVTSSISLLEVVVAYFVDEWRWSRERSVWLLGLACLLVSVVCATYPPFMGLVVKIFYTYALSFGAFLLCLFIGWRWGTKEAIAELTADGRGFPLLGLWAFLIRYICPVVTGVIVGLRVWDLF